MDLPKNEPVWERLLDRTGRPRFFITSHPARDVYFLYEAAPGGFSKLGRARTPPELKEKYRVQEALDDV